NCGEAARDAARLVPDPVKRFETATVKQHARNDVEPLIAGRSGYARPWTQRLAFAQNLLDKDIKSGGPPLALDLPLQSPEVLLRLAHGVDVIEAQPLQPAFGDQAKNRGMGPPKYVGFLNPNPGKLIDVKKPPVVDLALGEPP